MHEGTRINGKDQLYDWIEAIYGALTHASYIFPSDTNLTCTLTALDTANTWSSWAEIEDNTGGTTLKLSAVFASNPGHITAIQEETLSEVNTVYMVQISYGASKAHITEQRFAGGTRFDDADNHAVFHAPEIPAGETVYYRMKTATAVADTVTVHFRYHVHT